MTTLTVIIADTHIGGNTALSLPEFTNDDDQTFTASASQRWLYDCWLDFWRYVWAFHASKLVIVHLGDMVEGNHHGSTQLMPNIKDQERMAEMILKPLANMADGQFYCTRGTSVHVGVAAQCEVRICREIGARICDWNYTVDIDGCLIDCAHTGRAGQRDWTSSAAAQAAEVIIDCAKNGDPIPRYVFRGHRHLIDDSGEKIAGTRCIIAPAWQLKTEYGYKVAPGRRSDIGGIIIMDGALDLSHLRYYAGKYERKVYHA